jgi:hypothetical protein
MNVDYSGTHCIFPVSPAQRFVDEQGNDITNVVATFDQELFEALAEYHASIEAMERLGPMLEALREMITSGRVVAIPVVLHGDNVDESEYQVDPSFIPGNATRH